MSKILDIYKLMTNNGYEQIILSSYNMPDREFWKTMSDGDGDCYQIHAQLEFDKMVFDVRFINWTGGFQITTAPRILESQEDLVSIEVFFDSIWRKLECNYKRRYKSI